MQIDDLAHELRQRWAYPYRWHQQQNDIADRATAFIYHTPRFRDLLSAIARLDPDTRDYALNRWYNFWSAKGVQAIFCSHPLVRPERDVYHKTIDFYIDTIPFDHKTTVFPSSYPGGLRSALHFPRAMIDWLYANQSTGQRHHSANRLFLILWSNDRQHWRLKADLLGIAQSVNEYLDHFDPAYLHVLPSGAMADSIYYISDAR